MDWDQIRDGDRILLPKEMWTGNGGGFGWIAGGIADAESLQECIVWDIGTVLWAWGGPEMGWVQIDTWEDPVYVHTGRWTPVRIAVAPVKWLGKRLVKEPV